MERTPRIGRGGAGNLRIRFVASVTFSFIPALLRQFRDQAPEVHLDLKEMGSAQQVSAIHADALDAGLVRPPLFQDEGLSTRPLLEEPIVAVLLAGHRLAGQQELDVSVLATESFVMYHRHLGPGLFDCIVLVCQRAGFSPHVVQEAALVPTIVGLVAGGLGISLVPASVEPPGSLNVVYRPIRDVQAVTELVAIWRTTDGNPALGTLLQCLEACIRRRP